MTEKEQIYAYVPQDVKHEVERNAEAKDLSVSKYIGRLIERQMLMDAEDDLAREVEAEERLREVANLATDEIQHSAEQVREIVDDLEEMQARTGVYAVANWELLKQDYADPARRDALSTGSKRLRDEREPIDAEPDASASATDEDNRTASDDEDWTIFDDLREGRESNPDATVMNSKSAVTDPQDTENETAETADAATDDETDENRGMFDRFRRGN